MDVFLNLLHALHAKRIDFDVHYSGDDLQNERTYVTFLHGCSAAFVRHEEGAELTYGCGYGFRWDKPLSMEELLTLIREVK